MTIFSLYVFSKRGSCLYQTDWHRTKSPLADAPGEDAKLMFGLLFSLKVLMNKMNPAGCVRGVGWGGAASTAHTHAPLHRHTRRSDMSASAGGSGPDSGFFRYACSGYVLHHLETPTGYRIVLTSDAAAGDLRGVLWSLYEQLLVGYALKNPLYAPGTTITATAFVTEVDRYVRSLPAFTAK